jgi:hypothetical protein
MHDGIRIDEITLYFLLLVFHIIQQSRDVHKKALKTF